MSETRTPETTAAFRTTWVTSVKLHDPQVKKTAEETLDFLNQLADIAGYSAENLYVRVGDKSFTPPISRGAKEVQSGKFEIFDSMGLMIYAFKGEKADLNFHAVITHGVLPYIYLSFNADDSSTKKAIDAIKLSVTKYSFSLGYSLDMQNAFSPFYFLSNVINSSTPDILQKAQQNFIVGNRRRLHQQGFFRDVFRLNVLSRPHLSASVGGIPFSEWVTEETPVIEGNAIGRGQLSQISEDNWLWQVERTQLSSLRQTMVASGLIMQAITEDQYNAMDKPN